jgi:hypothetical protein
MTVQTLIPGVTPVAFVPQADGSVIGYAPLSHLPRVSPTRAQYDQGADQRMYDIVHVHRPERGHSPRRARSPVPPVIIDVNPEHDSARQARDAYQSSGWRFRFPFTSRRRSSSREGSVRSPRKPARRADSQDAVGTYVARPKTVWL